MITPLDTDNLLTRLNGLCYDQLRVSVGEDASDIVNSHQWWHSMYEFDQFAIDQQIHDILTNEVKKYIEPDAIIFMDLNPNETITIEPTFNLEQWQ